MQEGRIAGLRLLGDGVDSDLHAHGPQHRVSGSSRSLLIAAGLAGLCSFFWDPLRLLRRLCCLQGHMSMSKMGETESSWSDRLSTCTRLEPGM